MGNEWSPESGGEDIESLRQRVRLLETRLGESNAQLVAIQEMGAALGSTINLDRILAVILSKITELLGADRSTLFLLDESRQFLVAKIAQGLDIGERDNELKLPIGEGIAGWVAKTGNTVNIKDAYRDKRFNPSRDRQSGYRTTSMLCQPMRNYRHEIIGVVQALNKQSGYFTVDDERMLAALSTQAAISVENSQLYVSMMAKNIELQDAKEKLQQKTEEQDALLRIEEVVSTVLDLDSVLERVLERASQIIPSEAGSILLKDRTTNQLVFRTSRGPSADAVKRLKLEPGTGIVGWVAQTGKSVLTNDVANDPRHAKGIAETLGMRVHTAICVPISAHQEVLGAIQLLDRKRPKGQYTEDDLKLLTLISGQVAKAIEAAHARDELINQNRMIAIGQMLSGILHDFRTPMTVVRGNVQLMERENDPIERRHHRAIIETQIRHLDTMTREVLAYARGEKNLLLRTVHLNSFFAEAMDVLRPEFAERQVNLRVALNYAGDIRMDDVKMRRVLFNLSRNALEVLPAGGTFEVETTLVGTDVVFRFSDNGPGIPEEIRDRLFEPFVTRGKQYGTGLGLAIVKRIVDEHHGTIKFETSRLHGTSFVISLPRFGDTPVQPSSDVTQ